MSSKISTILRVHDTKCLPTLERALFSLTGQIGVAVEAIIVCQDFSKTQVLEVRKTADAYGFGSLAGIQVLNVAAAGQRDIRSRLLNVGIQHKDSKYIAFLDYDDIIYPNCYNTLVNRLKQTDAKIAFGGIVSTVFMADSSSPYIIKKHHEFQGDNVYSLFVDNFCPIHSYVIDTEGVDDAYMRFDEGLTALEDYSFLLKFCSKYPADFGAIKTFVGEYFRRPDDTIGAQYLEMVDSRRHIPKISVAREKIDRLKQELAYETPLSEFPWLLKAAAESRKSGRGFNGKDEAESAILHDLASEGVAFLFQKAESGDAIPALTGYVENASVTGDHLTVSGWLDDGGLGLAGHRLVCCTKFGQLILDVERFDRKDVRTAMGIAHAQLGFKFSHDALDHLEDLDISACEVIVLDSSNKSIGRVKKIGEAEKVPPQTDQPKSMGRLSGLIQRFGL